MNLSGNIFDYFIVYWSGVLVSFTPCVYPVMPLTAGFIAGLNTQGTRWLGFLLSLIYVLGIAVTYSVLGAVAALTGKIFGQLQNHPAIFIIVGVVLVFFSLMMFDKIPLPSFGISAHHRIKQKNFWTIILFG